MRRRSFYRRANGKDEARVQEAVFYPGGEDAQAKSESAEAQPDAAPKKTGVGWQPCPHCGRPGARYFHILWCKDNPERGQK